MGVKLSQKSNKIKYLRHFARSVSPFVVVAFVCMGCTKTTTGLYSENSARDGFEGQSAFEKEPASFTNSK